MGIRITRLRGLKFWKPYVTLLSDPSGGRCAYRWPNRFDQGITYIYLVIKS